MPRMEKVFFCIVAEKFASEDTKQQKKVYLEAKKVYFEAKKVYIFEENAYMIYRKNAEKFTKCKPV